VNATLQVEVTAIDQLTPTIRAIELTAIGEPLPAFSAGSHVTVHLPTDPAHRNAYSLACSPSDPGSYRLAVRHDVAGAGGSRWIHEQLAEGRVLRIERPCNFFAPIRTARHQLLIAGGIGITPFVSYAHQLSRDAASFELHYAVRAADELPFLDELLDLCGERLHVYVDPDGSALMKALRDTVLTGQPLGTHLSVCGPGAMMDAVTGAAAELGWPAARVHVERFSLPGGERTPFVAIDHLSHRRIAVTAEQTLLEALEDAGYEMPYLCRQGICGQCLTTVRAGAPDHRDVYLTPEERGSGTLIMPCVSRAAAAPLVLELPRCAA
jgi:ferredoxin-NADP reductase